MNINNGFTIFGWYKKEEINNQSNSDENDNKTSSGDVTQNIVSIKPKIIGILSNTYFKRIEFNVEMITK